MTGKIFINYRRGDDPGNTGRLYDRLEHEFGAGQLFMDVEGQIKGGEDFVEVLQAQVAQCDVLLAIIGPRWLEASDENGRRRIDYPEDWVRTEIIGALEMGKRVIPVLVGGAAIPRAEDLPESLKPLARRQAIRITLERFKADAHGLVSQVRTALTEIEQARAAANRAKRQAASDAERAALDDMPTHSAMARTNLGDADHKAKEPRGEVGILGNARVLRAIGIGGLLGASAFFALGLIILEISGNNIEHHMGGSNGSVVIPVWIGCAIMGGALGFAYSRRRRIRPYD